MMPTNEKSKKEKTTKKVDNKELVVGEPQSEVVETSPKTTGESPEPAKVATNKSESKVGIPDFDLSKRPERSTARTSALDVPKRYKKEGFRLRWVTPIGDSTMGDAIEEYEDMGYKLVQGPSKEVDRPAGGGKRRILMSIPEEWYKTYQAEKEAEIVKDETAIYRQEETAEGRQHGAEQVKNGDKGVIEISHHTQAPNSTFGGSSDK